MNIHLLLNISSANSAWRGPYGPRGRADLKRYIAYSKVLGRIRLDTFAVFSLTVLALVVFAIALVVTVIYRSKIGIDPTKALPVWLILIMATLILPVPMLFANWLGKAFAGFVNAYTDYLLQARGGVPVSLAHMPFSELRRLRAALIRTVGHMSRELDELKAIAFTDQETGLPNSIALERALDLHLRDTHSAATGGLIYLEIDGLERGRESLGQFRGAPILSQIADQLNSTIAKLSETGEPALTSYLLAVLSENRLALFLPKAGGREAVARVVRAMREVFATPFEIGGRSITLRLSGGIAMCMEDGDSSRILLQNARLALKTVREELKDGFRFYAPRLNRLVRGRIKLESELREAVHNKEFCAVFQPKIDFNTGNIIGAEALARWRRGGGKIISPGAFIQLAEDMGLIEEIGQQILEQACIAAQEWAGGGHDISVAVNVSPLQFERVDFTETILDALKRTGLPPHRLELEITEGMAVSDPQRVADVMRPLKAMGVALAIDDFGTGHSNLSMLTRLPFDVFKIDRSFVSGLDRDAQAPAIVEMILAMAETLGLKTVAEGVETPQQADFLRRRGCTIAQGFLYSPGLPQTEFLDLLNGWDSRCRAEGARKTG